MWFARRIRARRGASKRFKQQVRAGGPPGIRTRNLRIKGPVTGVLSAQPVYPFLMLPQVSGSVWFRRIALSPLRLDSSVPPRSHRRANNDAAGKSSGSVGTIGRRTAARLCRSALCRHRVKLTPWLPRLDTVSGVSLYERLSRPAPAGPHAAATQITRAAETVDPEREELGALDYTRTTITATKETIDNDREPLATHDLDSIRRRLTARTVETRAPETVDPDRQLAAAALQDRR
jgi:hypothetical protein